MKAIDAMFIWTPNREPFGKYPLRGTVEVTTIPETPAQRAHTHSMGACDYSWRQANDQGRLARMQAVITQMITEDFIDSASIRAALQQVDEFRNHTFNI